MNPPLTPGELLVDRVFDRLGVWAFGIGVHVGHWLSAWRTVGRSLRQSWKHRPRGLMREEDADRELREMQARTLDHQAASTFRFAVPRGHENQ